MGLRTLGKLVIIGLALSLACVSVAGADVVGRLTEVEGRVDLLKGGNLPATLVKVDDTVASKDVIRTKSLSKAQVTFIDNSVLTISPESRIAIEEYTVNPAEGKRRAVLEIFQGLAMAVVNKIYKVEEPDFVIKTHTAVMGVRGTEIGVRIEPNSSTIMNFKGRLQVGNVFPEISQLFLKAFKVAYSFSWNEKSNRWVFLDAMQATTVARDLPPTLPYGISVQDREMFMRQLTACVPSSSKFCQATADLNRTVGTASATPVAVASVTPITSDVPGNQTTLAIINTVTVPPVVTPPVQPVQPTTFSFTQQYTGPYSLTSVSPNTVGVFSSTGPGAGIRTGVYAGTFTASYNFNAIWNNPSMRWITSYTGTFTATMSAHVTGTLGQVLSGTMTMTFTDSPNGGQFQLTGPVTISPNGAVICNFTGTGVAFPNQDPLTVTSGVINQTPTSPPIVAAATASTPIVSAPPIPMVTAAVNNMGSTRVGSSLPTVVTQATPPIATRSALATATATPAVASISMSPVPTLSPTANPTIGVR